MSAIAFLGVALVISVVGSLVLWARYRQRPGGVTTGVDEFTREMRALAPRGDERQRRTSEREY